MSKLFMSSNRLSSFLSSSDPFSGNNIKTHLTVAPEANKNKYYTTISVKGSMARPY